MKATICIVTVLMAGIWTSQGQNLLTNPGFETASSGIPTGWTVNSALRSGWLSSKGKGYCLNLSGSSSYPIGTLIGAYQDLDAAPGEQWSLSGYMLNDNSMSLGYGNVTLLRIEFRDASGTLANYDSAKMDWDTKPMETWNFYSVSAEAPTGTTTARIWALMIEGYLIGEGGSPEAGQGWVDEMLADRTPAVPEPASYVLIGLGLGLAAVLRRQRRSRV